MKKQVFRIQTSYTFTGTFTVRAGSADEARQIVSEQCGMTIGGNGRGGGIHSTLDAKTVDWEFPVHADARIEAVRMAGGTEDPALVLFDAMLARQKELHGQMREAIVRALREHGGRVEVADTEGDLDTPVITCYGEDDNPNVRITAVALEDGTVYVYGIEVLNGELLCYDVYPSHYPFIMEFLDGLLGGDGNGSTADDQSCDVTGGGNRGAESRSADVSGSDDSKPAETSEPSDGASVDASGGDKPTGLRDEQLGDADRAYIDSLRWRCEVCGSLEVQQRVWGRLQHR